VSNFAQLSIVNGRNFTDEERASLSERRIEPDKSLTIYHFFTGLPAQIGKRPTVGLGEADAIRVMRLLKGSTIDPQ
jgi:hypothetical protein